MKILINIVKEKESEKMGIKLIVDSSSDIVAREAEKLGIVMLPMDITFGNEQFSDGINISHREFYEKLVETDELPKTSQITEQRFEEAFKKEVDAGNYVICITISSKLSTTFSNAERAAEKFPGKVFAIDSLNVTIGERILIQYATRLIEHGMKADKIAEELNRKKKNIRLLALLSTLQYLKKGGRISAMTAMAGELLNIKPVISITDGEVKLVGKAMGSKKGNNLIVQMIEKDGAIDFFMPIATAYTGLSDELLKKYMRDSEPIWKPSVHAIPSYTIGSTIGTHAGPGAIAVAYFRKDAD